MTGDEFVTLVREMRTQQRAFFKTRHWQALNNAQRLERAVDKALAAYTPAAVAATHDRDGENAIACNEALNTGNGGRARE